MSNEESKCSPSPNQLAGLSAIAQLVDSFATPMAKELAALTEINCAIEAQRFVVQQGDHAQLFESIKALTDSVTILVEQQQRILETLERQSERLERIENATFH